MTKASFLIPMAVLACICQLCEVKSSRRVASFLRQRRHLLFPDPRGSETKLQVLFGLGLPMEGEVSMTLGYVLKCNYDLPYNASELMRQRRRSKRHEGDFALPRTTTASRPEGKVRPRLNRACINEPLSAPATILCSWESFACGDPYCRIPSATFTREHKWLHLAQVFLAHPYVSLSLRTGWMTRWTLYGMLESAMNALGSGKACLLRAVCETAANPFDTERGLLGELVHVFLTPSTTQEEYEVYADREYHAAEEIGRNIGSRGKCERFYPECEYNPLDYFTKLV
ncbi:uncharacterized protein LOC109611097 [Ooceraea biroi]|uniref:uncharacterized protein LOC109611097 n=1 Tax=Ooceraea biroi TaxID=2015173 RepID=UPI000F07E292|nr:uncharacterized protein LOC109611097 [Ooceraea biroi]